MSSFIHINIILFFFSYNHRKKVSPVAYTANADGDVRDTIEVAINISMPYAKTLPLTVRKLFINLIK